MWECFGGAVKAARLSPASQGDTRVTFIWRRNAGSGMDNPSEQGEMQMADGAAQIDIRKSVTEAEWKARVDLAALYRLTALYGWDDMIFTHISHRVPGPTSLLINPMAGSSGDHRLSLVKVDDGNIVRRPTR